MVETKPQTPTTTSKPAGGGRPSKGEARDPKDAALQNLQYVLDRACNFIHDGPSSYARRAKSAARNGIPKETVDRGLAAMEAALKDARAFVDRTYSAPAAKAAPKSRVALG